jgi:hypothetical protein
MGSKFLDRWKHLGASCDTGPCAGPGPHSLNLPEGQQASTEGGEGCGVLGEARQSPYSLTQKQCRCFLF